MDSRNGPPSSGRPEIVTSKETPVPSGTDTTATVPRTVELTEFGKVAMYWRLVGLSVTTSASPNFPVTGLVFDCAET